MSQVDVIAPGTRSAKGLVADVLELWAKEAIFPRKPSRAPGSEKSSGPGGWLKKETQTSCKKSSESNLACSFWIMWRRTT
jgi:hypothetical protein